MLVKVFISYKHQDKNRNQWVEKLCKDLRFAGIDAKLDNWEVPPGESFSDYMTRGIRHCDHVLFIVTPKSVRAVQSGRGALAFEMQISNARRLAKKDGFNIIPIFREGSTTSTYLSDLRYVDFRNDDEYDSKLTELIQWLLEDVQAPKLGPPSLYFTIKEIKKYLQDCYQNSISENLKNDVGHILNSDIYLEDTKLRTSLQLHFFNKFKDILTGSEVLPQSDQGYTFLYTIASNLDSINVKIRRPLQMIDSPEQHKSVIFDIITADYTRVLIDRLASYLTVVRPIVLLSIIDDDRFLNYKTKNITIKTIPLFKVTEIIGGE